MDVINIGEHKIGPDEPVFIIAEAGINHNGDMEIARKLIDVAVEAGAHAVKFQTINADKLTSADAPKAAYQLENTGNQESQHDMLQRVELTWDDHKMLQSYCNERGIIFISSPFDEESIDLLDRLEVPAFKVPSGESINLPYLRRMARKNRPIILSTGMSNLAEVDEAVRTINAEGNEQVIVLHCVSNYPASPASVNLKAMATMSSALGVLTGFSDHTLGTEIPIASAALGAVVIEKHFTLDRNMEGPDHLASLEPDELAEMVRTIRNVKSALGNGIKRSVEEEEDTRLIARKSLHAGIDMEAGHTLAGEDLISLRPGTGILPNMLDVVLGRHLNNPVKKGQMLTWDNLV